MADLAVSGTQDLSFSNSNASWVTAVNTTGKSVARFALSDFTDSVGVVAQLTFAKYNGRDILPQLYSNPSTANRVAGVLGDIVVVLGADAGNNNLELKWSSSNFMDVQAVFYTGDIDSAGIDAAYVTSENVNVSGTCTPTAFTPVSDKALPFFSFASQSMNGTIVALANCTKDIGSGLDSGVGTFSCPLSTPAGTATSATLTQGGGNNGHNLVISGALKPLAASSTLTLTGTKPYFTGGGTIYGFKGVIGGTTDVVVAGTYTGGTPTHVEYQLGGAGGFSTISNEVIGSGNWAGKIPAMSAGDTSAVLRWSNSTGTSVTTLVSVAINAWVGGDSEGLMPNAGNVTASATPQKVRWLHPTNGWVDWDSTANFEQGAWAYFGNEITAGHNMPVFILNGAVAGSSFDTWLHGQTNFNNAAALVPSVNGGLHMIIMPNLGTNAARGGSGNTTATVLAAVTATCADLRSFVDATAPIFWPTIGPVDTNTGGGTLRTEMDAVRSGLAAAVATGICYYGQHIYDQTYATDGLHPDANDLAEWGRRLYLEVVDRVFGKSYGHGPRLEYISTNAAKDTSMVRFSPALSIASGSVGGFRAEDGGGVMTISSATLVDATHAKIVTSVGANGVLKISFGSGNDAIATTCLCSAVTLPTGNTVQRPLEFFLNVIPGDLVDPPRGGHRPYPFSPGSPSLQRF